MAVTTWTDRGGNQTDGDGTGGGGTGGGTLSGRVDGTGAELDALVRRAQRGDRDALGQLYDQFRDRIARFATARLGDVEKAEDVTSETFESMLRSLGRYRQGTDFAAWLFTIAHRRVHDHFRRLGRRRETSLDTVEPDLPSVRGPEEEALAAADRTAVRFAFQTLRAEEQEVLALRVMAGLSAEQAGAVLGKSPGAVRVAQHRALRSLRGAMGLTVT
jgi:RNA polymerase sigma-70 factor (ECF subfamily)